MSMQSINLIQLGALHTALDVHNLFRQLGYPVETPDAFIGDDLDALELNPADRANVARAYIVARLNTHTVYLYEVNDLRTARLRSLAWNALQRGTGLLIVATPAERGAYRQILFVDPRFAGKPIKSSVRVAKLKVITAEPTRHDLDTLNAIHAHRRSAQQVYDEQGKAFNVTTVTKRFYDEYRGHYERAKAAIAKANPGVREFYDADKLHAFTQRLLGRLMFLYFLQRKGWLGERARFLTERYTALQRQHAGETGDGDTYRYYTEVLEPLFFQTLNTKRPGNITKWEGIRIPYLNGGLFDEARDPSGPILIPDALFDPNDVTGLLGFFNRYNFTIADDTPLEQDVAVDPEMLGKVFENLLEERDRGQSGSFYTPRPIVAYMCQEALAGYLEESAKDANGISISRETTRALFDPDADARLTPDEAVRMNAALDTLTVLDPAVGSGSFLIGMLNELLHLRHAAYAVLHPDEPVPNPQTLSDWKEAIIRDTLYGVDIKPEAIEIAQLRLWLALVVDQTLEQARPLPNLDYKLMAGNSLIETIDGEPVLGTLAAQILNPADSSGMQWEHVRDQLQLFDPNPTQGRMLLFDEEKEAHQERIKLDEMRREYFSASPERRKQLKPEIMAQERQIVAASLRERADKYQQQVDEYGRKAALANGVLKAADQRKLTAAVDHLKRLSDVQMAMGKPDTALPFFLYQMHFSEVFERKGGFDIVVANPPYVRMELIKEQKDEFERVYPEVYAGRADLFVYFYVRGYQLLKPKGQFAFISSNKFMRAKYGEGLRRFLSSQALLHCVIDFGDLPVFDAAAYPCIVIAEKSKPNDKPHSVAILEIDDLSEIEDLPTQVSASTRTIQSTLTSEVWQVSEDEIRTIILKISQSSIPLTDYLVTPALYGIKTGLNDAFVVTASQYSEFTNQHPASANVIKPFLVGRDVKRWVPNFADRYLVFAFHGIEIKKYPSLLAHLEQFRMALEKRATAKHHEWYELQQPQVGTAGVFEKPKIVYPIIAATPQFALDTSGAYTNDKTFVIPSDDLFLLGILNSKVAHMYLDVVSSKVRGGYLEFRWTTLSTLPIPNPPAELRERIAAAARACLDAAKDHPDRLPALEAELNALVYQAYGLDEDDIAVIEGSVGKRQSETDAVPDEPQEPS